jgi:hypothetical protein
MCSLDERQALIASLRYFPSQVETAVNAFAAAQRDTPCGAGEWTVRQVVHHIADAHLNGYIRMKLVLTEFKPILKPYDQDAWACLADMSGPLSTSLTILRGVHERWYLLLADLPEESWNRSGVHLENGLMTLKALLEGYVSHGNEHLAQLQRLRAALGIDQ